MTQQQRMIVPADHHLHEMAMEDVVDFSIPNSPKKLSTGDQDQEGIMELLWKNGHVVMQNQRQSKKTAEFERDIRLEEQQLFMQEDEMASWIQYPLDDLYADLLYPVPPPPPPPIPTIAQPRVVAEIRSPPPPPLRRPLAPPLTVPDDAPRLQNFVHFSRLPAKQRTEREVESTIAQPAVDRGASATARESATMLSTSPDGSRGSFSSERPAEDRKRKARENEDDEYQSEDIFEFEAAEPKKRARGSTSTSTSTKRSRAAEVHNQSERRRRDRINEKMRALQELIPRCNKSDKASMLDEAIEYLKSLQMQVQMMSSMGCPMVPMMYPGMQQYMPAMGLGMGVNHPPMLPYPCILNPAHMGPRFPMMPAPYRTPQVAVADPSRTHASNETDHPASLKNQYQNQPRMPNLVDPYQRYVGMRFPLPQNQAAVVSQPGANKSSSRSNLDNQQMGN